MFSSYFHCTQPPQPNIWTKTRKLLVAIAQKLDLIEQNQCDFWIQRIRFVLNQLTKRRQQNCCWPVLCTLFPNYINRRILLEAISKLMPSSNEMALVRPSPLANGVSFQMTRNIYSAGLVITFSSALAPTIWICKIRYVCKTFTLSSKNRRGGRTYPPEFTPSQARVKACDSRGKVQKHAGDGCRDDARSRLATADSSAAGGGRGLRGRGRGVGGFWDVPQLALFEMACDQARVPAAASRAGVRRQ